ncbi:hypothetical protein U1Q18_036640, partial [Sarracenia purpurea var. burkii]
EMKSQKRQGVKKRSPGMRKDKASEAIYQKSSAMEVVGAARRHRGGCARRVGRRGI